jgi:hypothetical protein
MEQEQPNKGGLQSKIAVLAKQFSGFAVGHITS